MVAGKCEADKLVDQDLANTILKKGYQAAARLGERCLSIIAAQEERESERQRQRQRQRKEEGPSAEEVDDQDLYVSDDVEEVANDESVEPEKQKDDESKDFILHIPLFAPFHYCHCFGNSKHFDDKDFLF